MSEDLIESNYNGVLVVRAKNALFNAGFDGLPRTLPDGTIFATDKALKYCIREYLALFKELPVFVRRDRYVNDEGNLVYSTLEENFEKKTGLDLKKASDKKILSKLKEFVDVRLFGIVFSPKKDNKDNKGRNISLTGPVQVSYGINKFPKSQIYMNNILSPYNNPKEDQSRKQTTIGNEARADEVYYVYDISVNKNNAVDENNDLGTGMTNKDLEILKEALMRSVDIITSTTKFGVESVALLWFENKENLVFNNLNDFVKVYEKEGEKIVDFSELKDYLINKKISEAEIEIESKKVKVI